jgi:hypothetical protein
MATKTEVIVSCDLDGKTAGVETVEIAINGKAMELELCEGCKAKTVDKFLATVEPVARIGARDSVRARRGRANQTRPRHSDAVEVRAWLVENGFEVSSHGRISAEHRAAYESRRPALATAS